MGGGEIAKRLALPCSMVREREQFLFNLLNFIIDCVEIDRESGANGFRVSNPSIHQCAALAASLEV